MKKILGGGNKLSEMEGKDRHWRFIFMFLSEIFRTNWQEAFTELSKDRRRTALGRFFRVCIFPVLREL